MSITTSTMTAQEARQIVDAINGHMTSARALLLDLYQREGWRALGYINWRECAVAEFGQAQRTLYQQLDAAQVEQHICAIAQNHQIGTIPESHLRPLAPYKDNPEFVQQVYQEAVDTAPNGKMTATHVAVVTKNRAEETESVVLEEKHDLDATSESVGGDFGVSALNRVVHARTVMTSSKTHEHYTPADILEAVYSCLGAVDLDPCSNSHHSPNVKSKNHFTKEDDGLSQEWRGRVFINPPYSIPRLNDDGSPALNVKGQPIMDSVMHLWARKLIEEHEAGRVTEAIALVRGDSSTQWHRLFRDFVRCEYAGRVQFIGNNNSATFPTHLFYLGNNIDHFYYAFYELGDIYQRLEPGMFGQ